MLCLNTAENMFSKCIYQQCFAIEAFIKQHKILARSTQPLFKTSLVFIFSKSD